MEKFHYLKLGLSAVLVFVGAKMLLTDTYKIPVAVSLAVVVGLLPIAVIASLMRPLREAVAIEPELESVG